MTKVAIVADAFGSRHLAPYDDPEWEIWGLGNGYIHMERADRYFELHPWWNIIQHNDVSQEFSIRDDLGVKETFVHEDLLTEWPVDLRSQSFVRFPWEEIVRRNGRRYFTSSVCWLLGYALAYARPDEIAMFGVEQSLEEYKWERNCTEYWCGRLEQAGTKITLPPYATLLQPERLYGFEFEQAVEEAGLFESDRARATREAEDWTKKVIAARTASVFAEGRLRQLKEPKDLEWVMEGFNQAREIVKETEKGLLEAMVRVDVADHHLYERTLGAGALHDGTAKAALEAYRRDHPKP